MTPLYYDPVHDFGFLSFDPTKLQFMESGHIPLAPEAARVGLEVRVVGNDSGEKASDMAVSKQGGLALCMLHLTSVTPLLVSDPISGIHAD